jgi:hypothetical protein
MAFCEVSHKEEWTKGTTAIRGPSGLKYPPLEKVITISDCLEYQFTPHDLCNENHKRHVHAGV